MRFGSTTKVLAESKLKYYRISGCVSEVPHLRGDRVTDVVCRVCGSDLNPVPAVGAGRIPWLAFGFCDKCLML